MKRKLNGKILEEGFNSLGNELKSLHQYYFEVRKCISVLLDNKRKNC